MSTPSDFRSGEDVDHGVGLRTSLPPSRFAPVRRWVLDSLAELHQLREGLREEIAARDHRLADRILNGVAHDLLLIATELAANAIRHGRPPTIVELLEHEDRFLLKVADHDLSTEPRITAERAHGTGGFGLRITQRLSLDAAWYRAESVKVVWAELGAA